jgi:hypothetical protein
MSEPQDNNEQLKDLERAIVREIENPTVKSKISTADIRVMGISSTGMSDRMFTIMQLIKQHDLQLIESIQAELPRNEHICSYQFKVNQLLNKKKEQL